LPADDGVHEQALTEWWYYTGHLRTNEGRLFGFEQVFFRARRGDLSGWAAHVALTDGEAARFVYDQRRVLGSDGVPRGAGIDFALDDWSIVGRNGRERVIGSVGGTAFTLALASLKPAALHGGDGFTAGDGDAGSFYYSRTRYDVEGLLSLDDAEHAVSGHAWMDHQWGDFTSFSENGWDWFALQLEDDTELMLYYLRDADGNGSLGVGTVVEADGSVRDIGRDDVRIEATGSWTSPDSGAIYPSGWRLELAGRELTLELEPVLRAQELDTRETTGLTYWEGQVRVHGNSREEPIAGLGYVELTGYARARDGAVP
jgi:predicted secreted hydrolase